MKITWRALNNTDARVPAPERPTQLGRGIFKRSTVGSDGQLKLRAGRVGWSTSGNLSQGEEAESPFRGAQS